MTALKIMAVILIVAGAAINYSARLIVRRLSLTERVTVPGAHEFNEEELLKYKEMKALSMVKMAGLIALIPGVVLVFIAFR